MANAPDRYEKFVVPEGVNKIEFVRDTRVANAGTFIVQREDHTVGNLVRMQLHRDDAVTFAGYRVPHPLEFAMHIKVQTNGTKTPVRAVAGALTDLYNETAELCVKFEEEARKIRQAARQSDQYYN